MKPVASRVFTAYGELSVETEMIEVPTMGPEPSRSWDYTDAAGHRHVYGKGYPSLVYVSDGNWWCPDCRDEHQDGHWECRLCAEHIAPGMTRGGTTVTHVPGVTRYLLNGREIGEQEWGRLFALAQQDRVE